MQEQIVGQLVQQLQERAGLDQEKATQVALDAMLADDTLAAPQMLGAGFRLIPAVGADTHNRFLVGWETLDLGTGAATGYYSVTDPDTGVWGTPAYLPGGESGAPIGLGSTDSGQVRVVMADGLGLASISDFQLSGSVWSADTATWSTPDPIEGESATVRNGFENTGFGHQPRAAMAENGDLFAIWTNDRWVSNPHRVVNPQYRDRYSIPLFVTPPYRARIACLPSCLGEGETPKTSRYAPFFSASSTSRRPIRSSYQLENPSGHWRALHSPWIEPGVTTAEGWLLSPAAWSQFALLVAAWTLAFGIFVAIYGPILWLPRVDGKPG